MMDFDNTNGTSQWLDKWTYKIKKKNDNDNFVLNFLLKFFHCEKKL